MIATVLGASGFLGINLASALANAGHTIRCFDRKSCYVPCTPKNKDRITFFEGDFFSPPALKNVLTGCDVCYHLISTSVPVTSNGNPAKDAQENIVGTLKLLDVACETGVKKIIFPSSGGAIYGLPRVHVVNESHPTIPVSSYGIAKLAIEKYLALYRDLYGLDYCSLRIANPYGPFQRFDSCQGIIGVFLGRILRKEPLEVWGDGTVIRDYIFIEDVVQALVVAANATSDEKVLNIGSGTGVSINELVETLQHVTQQELVVKYCPARKQEIPYSVLDISRAQSELDWSPQVGFEEGLQRTWQWIKTLD